MSEHDTEENGQKEDEDVVEEAARLAREAGYDEEVQEELIEKERQNRDRRRIDRRKRHSAEWAGEDRRKPQERRSGRDRREDSQRNRNRDGKYGHH